MVASLRLATDPTAPLRPTILFIAIDDLRAEPDCDGTRYIHSPNIDRCAAICGERGPAWRTLVDLEDIATTDVEVELNSLMTYDR